MLGGDAVDQLAGDAGDPGARPAAGVGDGQGRPSLSPRSATASRKAARNLLQSADQSLSNQQEVKVYGAQGVELERYTALANTNLKLSMKVESTRSISSAMVQLMGAVGLALLLFFAGARGDGGAVERRRFRDPDDLDDGDHPVAASSSPTCRACCSAAWPRPSGCSACSMRDDESDRGHAAIARAQGVLEFRQRHRPLPGPDASRRWPTSASPRGRARSPRSSAAPAVASPRLIKLIPRFYEPEAGAILLDGHPAAGLPAGRPAPADRAGRASR